INRVGLSVLRLLSPQELIMAFHKERERAVDFARLLSSFYLDFPLLLPSEESPRLPTLFAWSELSSADASAYASIDRTEFATRLPTCYSPKLPAVMLARAGFVLEAILYTDHFADRRSAVMLRMYGDISYGLTLTKQYCTELISDTLTRSINAIVGAPAHYETTIELIEENVVQSLLELDIVTGDDYIIKLEKQIMHKMEFLFAQLNVLVKEVHVLPRAPLYCKHMFIASDALSEEEVIHLKLHAYLRLFIHSLSKTNRLEEELHSSLSILAQYDFVFQAETIGILSTVCSPLSRLILLVLRLIYRDESTLASKEKSHRSSRILQLYQALLTDDENENDLKPFERFFSLARETDAAHIRLLGEWLRSKISKHSLLPPYGKSTRQEWYDTIIGSLVARHQDAPLSTPRGDTNDCAWLLNKIDENVKVDVARFLRMRFVSDSWTAYQSSAEGGLISLRLHLSPDDLCSPREHSADAVDGRVAASTFRGQHSTATARSFPDRTSPSLTGSLSFREDDSRRRRTDLIAEYARRKLERRPSARAAPPPTSRPVYFKNTMRQRLREISEFQRSLEAQLEAEEGFLESLTCDKQTENELRHRKRSGNHEYNKDVQTNTVSPGNPSVIPASDLKSARRCWENERAAPCSKKEAKLELERTIQEDLSRLNEKLDRIQQFLHDEDQDSSPKSFANSEIDLEKEEPMRIIHDEKIKISAPLEIEKLDFRALTPPPDVGRRKHIENSKNVKSSTTKSERAFDRIPPWVKLIPLKDPAKSALMPSSTEHKADPKSAEITTAPGHAERVAEPLDVANLSLHPASSHLVREMSADRVHTMINSFL
ncbi:hypothetical protein PMAYCL1PPCAC_21034, partial [Pristionchus mayeri]